MPFIIGRGFAEIQILKKYRRRSVDREGRFSKSAL